ncbi:acyl carrier protein [Allocatelliglobosispora scoriae]|uniref:Acyl carrier protein n=1 Tax=Allocatelliglobosispora scoriae TaxID=643052 RepID=A0A841C587_9ACTN|nr:acyl carrier protein [Allocatelliglobosispora scoriae]MBB5874303.1 acyl carrier protein [Allocatelliglobosispora scoriae]
MTDIYALVEKLLRERLHVSADLVDPGRTLEELGLDSLARVELGIMIDDECGIPPKALGAVTAQSTVGEVVDMLRMAQEEQA